jgi:hypothetical protein
MKPDIPAIRTRRTRMTILIRGRILCNTPKRFKA